MNHFPRHIILIQALVLVFFLAAASPAQPRHRIQNNRNQFMMEDLSTHVVKPYDMWISRLANGLFSSEYTDQIVGNLDDYLRYGVNTLVVSIQGANLGQGKNGLYPEHYNSDGTLHLQSPVWANLEKLLAETDRRRMVLIIQYWYALRADVVPNDDKALEITRNVTLWLKNKGYQNYILDVVNEVPHDAYGNRPIFRTNDVIKVIDAVHSVNPDLLVGVSPTSGLLCPQGWLDNPRRWVEADIIIGHNQVIDPLVAGAYKLSGPPVDPKSKPYINNEFWAQIDYEKDLKQNPRDPNLFNYGRYDQKTVDTYVADLKKLRGYDGYGGIHSFHQQRIPYLPAQNGPTMPVAMVGPEGTQPESSMGAGEPSLHWLYREIARIRKFGPLPTRKDFNEHAPGVEIDLGGDWVVEGGFLKQSRLSSTSYYARMVADEGDLEISFDGRFPVDPGANGRLGIQLGGATLTDPCYRLLIARDKITLDQVNGTLPSRTVPSFKLQQDQYRLRIQGGRVQVAVGGIQVLDVADTNPISGRNLHLFTQGATALFDNVRVTPLRLVDFEDGKTGAWAPEVTSAWKVESQGSNKRWEATTPVNEVRRALLDQRINDFALEFTVDLTGVQNTALLFRAADLTRAHCPGYTLEVARDGTVSLARQGDAGPPIQLGSATASSLNPAYVRVRLVVDGNRLAVHVDAKMLLDVMDPSPPLEGGGMALLARPGTTRYDDLRLKVGPSRFPIARFHPFTGPPLPKGFTIEFGDPDGILDLAGLSLQLDSGENQFVDITFVLIPWFSIFGFDFTADGRSLLLDLQAFVPLGPVNWTFRVVATDHDGNTTSSDLKIQ